MESLEFLNTVAPPTAIVAWVVLLVSKDKLLLSLVPSTAGAPKLLPFCKKAAPGPPPLLAAYPLQIDPVLHNVPVSFGKVRVLVVGLVGPCSVRVLAEPEPLNRMEPVLVLASPSVSELALVNVAAAKVGDEVVAMSCMVFMV